MDTASEENPELEFEKWTKMEAKIKGLDLWLQSTMMQYKKIKRGESLSELVETYKHQHRIEETMTNT